MAQVMLQYRLEEEAVFIDRHEAISVKEAISILNDEEYHRCNKFPFRPKGKCDKYDFCIYLKLAVLYLLCSIAFLSYIYSSSLPFFCYFLFFYLSLSLFLLGGEVFLFESKNSYKKSDWKADGHKWLNQGTTKLPRNQSTVGKSGCVPT
jgi:hypothetical protein